MPFDLSEDESWLRKSKIENPMGCLKMLGEMNPNGRFSSKRRVSEAQSIRKPAAKPLVHARNWAKRSSQNAI